MVMLHEAATANEQYFNIFHLHSIRQILAIKWTVLPTLRPWLVSIYTTFSSCVKQWLFHWLGYLHCISDKRIPKGLYGGLISGKWKQSQRWPEVLYMNVERWADTIGSLPLEAETKQGYKRIRDADEKRQNQWINCTRTRQAK